MKKIFSVVLFALCICSVNAQTISLAGKWQVSLGAPDSKVSAIVLPGTLDDAGIGEPIHMEPALNAATLAHLQRKVQYVGKAFYRRKITIPKSWKKSSIYLNLGRVLWQSTVIIDGQAIPVKEESLTTAHNFDISEFVIPGKKQELVICIDNSNIYPGINVYATQYPLKESAEMTHAYTNHTQIKWNGILGDITISRKPAISLSSVDVTPDIQHHQLSIKYLLRNPQQQKAHIQSYVIDTKTSKRWPSSISKNIVDENNSVATVSIPKDAVLWSEFSPRVYKLVAIINSAAGNDTLVTSFGIRELAAENGDLLLNGNRLFVRGNLECVIFPLKGYPPMKTADWKQLFVTAKSYGLNTFRFHSWCPPAVAFEAADITGFYLQVELPHWSLKVGADTASFRFLQDEARRIIKTYGNHPSFLFFSMGNELEGDFSKLKALVAELKATDKRHLYSTTTFTFQQGLSGIPQPEDDYFVTQWTKKGWVRGQGVFNSDAPDFSKDFSQSFENIKLPLISHEIGQYSVYPDIKEIDEYKGNLVPLNMIAAKNDLAKKGMLNLAPSFLQASGKLAAILYKEEIERVLKTKEMDGFQLLQLQDFPGQGTALVGLLNVFWKNKGFITPEWFHSFCSEVTPLIRFPKAVYTNIETFAAEVELANFFKPLNQTSLSWKISNHTGKVLASGKFDKADYPIGNCLKAGTINYPLNNIKEAQQLSVEVFVNGTKFHNQWNIWVYPKSINLDEGDVIVTSSFDTAITALHLGKKVLLCPQISALKGIDGKFVPVFWSPVHFPDQPGTMGLLVKNNHPALKDFPTDSFSNWQWWDLTTKSKTMIVDSLPEQAVIVRVIDNFVRNQHLSNLFEAKIGKGQLIFCSVDIVSDLDKRLQAKQLRYSLLNYMNSAAFKPSVAIDEAFIQQSFKQ